MPILPASGEVPRVGVVASSIPSGGPVETVVMVVWDTPFSASLFPAVKVVSEDLPILDIIVFPLGLDADIAYIVRFSNFVAIRVHQEGMMPSSYPNVDPHRKSCSFKHDNSTWKGEFVETSSFIEASFGRRFSELIHYLIIGGDHVVEVLAYEPNIDRIGKTELPS